MTAPKVTERVRSQILADYQAGVTPLELERRYGVKPRTINNWRRRGGYQSQTSRKWERACRTSQ